MICRGAAAATVLLRERAVQAVAVWPRKDEGRRQTVALFVVKHPELQISIRSLERWEAAYAAAGLDGLVDQKKGVVGRKPAAADLTAEDILRGKAAAIEHGAGGRTNIARAFQELSADPSLSAGARKHLHGGRASKSSVPQSIRRAFNSAPLTVGLAQVGPKAARLLSRWTPGQYEDCRAMDVVTADDMTANCYVWLEWPNEKGWLILRPQILAALDVGTLRWLSLRAVARAQGQYNKDDVWGLVGDVLDEYGAPGAFLFEGGTWRSNVVRGHRTAIDDEVRFGGLRSLGIGLKHSRSPRSKIIETCYNSLQYAADRVKGFSGREEKSDLPEVVKAQLALCKAGKAHPRQYFLHLKEYADHLRLVMAALNNERNDGKVLKGGTADDKFAADLKAKAAENQSPIRFPESTKWMYRSSYNVVQVGNNGVKVTTRSGKYREIYFYDCPEILTPLEGQMVAVYWNDHNPDADAIVLSMRDGSPHEFICAARRVTSPGRFNASKEELTDEAQRKAAALRYARTELRSVMPYCERSYRVEPPQAEPESAGQAGRIGQEIAAARERADAAERTERENARAVARVQLSAEDRAAFDSAPAQAQAAPERSAVDEFSQLFGSSEELDHSGREAAADPADLLG